MDGATTSSPIPVAPEGRFGRARLWYTLPGLEAGVLGSLALCGWLMVTSLWAGHSMWSIPNLFSTMLYGPSAYINGFARSSLAGLAIMILGYSVPGIVWGLLWQQRRHPFLRLIGAVSGLALYVFYFHLILPRTEPLIVLYAPTRHLEVAHLIWGIVLANSSRFAREFARSSGQFAVPGMQSWPGLSPHVDRLDHDAEIRSGEVIL